MIPAPPGKARDHHPRRGGVRTRRRRRTPRRTGTGPLAVAGVLLVSGALLAAVVALRPPTLPSLPSLPSLPDASTATDPPASAPVEPALGWAGFGDVVLGMSLADFRDGHRDPSGWESTVRVPGRDTGRGCIQYQIASRTGPTVWVWARDDRIVTVGIDQVGEAATSFGPRLGDPFGWHAALPAGWVVDPDLSILVARGSDGTTLATLADTDADGLLDYATVASPPGEECDLDPPAIGAIGPPVTGADELEGLALAGLGAVGVVVTDGRPSSPDDWFGTADVTLHGGCAAQVYWQRAPGIMPGIDRPVWAHSALGPPIVTDTVPAPC